MTKPWKLYACIVPAAGVTGTCTVLSTVHHVTHTNLALRILADGKITRGLIYDESILNDSRTTVVSAISQHMVRRISVRLRAVHL